MKVVYESTNFKLVERKFDDESISQNYSIYCKRFGKFVGRILIDDLLPENLLDNLSDDNFNKIKNHKSWENAIYLKHFVIYERHRGIGYAQGFLRELQELFGGNKYHFILLTPYPDIEDGQTDVDFVVNLHSLFRLYESTGFSEFVPVKINEFEKEFESMLMIKNII